MAKTRRSSRKGSRKAHRKSRRSASRKAHRKSHRKSRRSSRRSAHRKSYRGGRGLFSTVYSPVSHVIRAAEESVAAVTDTTRNIVRKGLSGVNRVGKSITGHADSAVRNVVSRKSRRNRRN